MWSRKFEKCVVCGTTEKRHWGLGLCKKCYGETPEARLSQKRYRNLPKIKLKNKLYSQSDVSKKWRKDNSEKMKGYQSKYRSSKKYKERRAKTISSPEYIKKRKEYEQSPKYKEYLERRKGSKAFIAKQKEYKHCPEIKLRRNENIKKRIKTDIRFRLRRNFSSSINHKLRKHLSSKEGEHLFSFLPYTLEELKNHIEKQFEPWMDWSNWGRGDGKWNIDHIKPDCSFNYKSVEDKEFQDCWALSNLRPLDAIENLKKGSKIIN